MMVSPPAFEKILLRNKIRTLRREIDPAWKAAASQVIAERVEKLPILQSAQVIHTYVAWHHEVDNHHLIRRLLREGRRVVVPKVEPGAHKLQHYFITDFTELQKGAYGILEPTPDPRRLAAPSQFDLVLVPGLAFDRSGNRLGMGAGYYDRFLAQVQAPKIALAFDFQLVEKLPFEAHDQRVTLIITEKNVILCS